MFYYNALLVISLIFCSSIFTVLSDCDTLDKIFYIRSKVSGLVLDASDNKGIRIQPFNSSSRYQQFQLQPASRTGLFKILNPYAGRALAFLNPGDRGYPNEVNFTLVYPESTVYQQFFLNSDGTIMNGGFYNFGLMIDENPFYAGNFVYVASGETFGEDQKFDLTNESNF